MPIIDGFLIFLRTLTLLSLSIVLHFPRSRSQEKAQLHNPTIKLTMAANGHNHQAVIGNLKNFWLYNSGTGFDLTHPPSPDAPPVSPRVTIETKTSPIAIDPAKSALVVVDMQNFFLSAALGRAKGAGHAATDQLLEHAIPACRRAGIRVVWLNWGLSEQEIDEMPPAVVRAFGFESVVQGKMMAVDKHGNPGAAGGGRELKDGKNGGEGNGTTVEKQGNSEHAGRTKQSEESKGGKKGNGLGSDMGTVTDPDSGEEIDAGKLLMRNQWNTALYAPLDDAWREGQKLATRPDVWIHKNRMSGMWGPSTACEEFLGEQGIRTLFFTGVNTDQCVGGTYMDCFSKGYDCVLLSDGCGTTSPAFAQENMEFNAANTFGFVTTCKALADGVGKMEK